MKNPVIDVNDRRPRWRVFLEKAFSLLATLCLWGLLFWGLDVELLGEKRPESLLMFLFFFAVAVLIFLIFSSWQFYNWHRFHGKDRRRSFPMPTLAEVGKCYGIAPQDMERLQAPCRLVEVYYQAPSYYYRLDHGQPIEIKSLRQQTHHIE
ncbi:PgaD family protein [Megasphaera sp.]|uniref:PgaD family protein n=1 Tax=Megasphaera sp. TaxID=2023260 RepID=UPI003521C50D